jgi:hypothetical protein
MRTPRTNRIKKNEREVSTAKDGTVKDTEVCGICKGCNPKLTARTGTEENDGTGYK